MAREATITNEQVGMVADALMAAGIKPTARSVRERLGRGSMATVLRMFRQWQGCHQPTAKAVDLPPEIALTLARHIEAEIARARADLEARLTEQDDAIADLIAECERGRDALAETEAERDSALREKAKVEGELALMMAERDAQAEEARRHLRDAETARTELAKATIRLEAMQRLEAANESLKERVEITRVQAEDAERRAAVLEARLAAEQTAHERTCKDAEERRAEIAGLGARSVPGKQMNARRRERLAHW